jgi:hypothetical protein
VICFYRNFDDNSLSDFVVVENPLFALPVRRASACTDRCFMVPVNIRIRGRCERYGLAES